jgi:hypothetical protein
MEGTDGVDIEDDELIPRVLELFSRFCSFGARSGEAAAPISMDGARCLNCVVFFEEFSVFDPVRVQLFSPLKTPAARFAKFNRDCGLLDKAYTPQSVDLVFAKAARVRPCCAFLHLTVSPLR